jgi:hypothetical protein
VILKSARTVLMLSSWPVGVRRTVQRGSDRGVEDAVKDRSRCPGLLVLRRWATLALDRYVAEHRPEYLVIVATGEVGLEMAEGRTGRGIKVVQVETRPERRPQAGCSCPRRAAGTA